MVVSNNGTLAPARADLIIACWIGNKTTNEFYSTSTMPEMHLSKFNGEKACFLPQFFVVTSFLFLKIQ